MRRAFFVLLAFTLTASAQTPRQAAGESHEQILAGWHSMPDLIWYEKFYPDPIFASVETALGATGKARRSLFQQHTAAFIDKLLAREPEEDCIRANTYMSLEEKGPPASFAAAVDSADIVALVTITGLRPGFSHGRPGQLARIQPSRLLKGSFFLEEKFIFIPLGNIRVGEKQLCATNPLWPELPKLGEQILLLSKDYYYNQESKLLDAGPSNILTLTQEGLGRLPSAYRRSDSDIREYNIEQLIAAIDNAMSDPSDE